MVDLVKARAKAKQRRAAPLPSEGRPDAAAPDKLERFKEEAGKRRERATATAAPAADADRVELIVFRIDGEQYAIEVERVMEIATPRPLTRVPNADPFVRGVMSLRGIVVTLVDVRARLRHDPHRRGEQVIVITDQGGPLGFDVDRVLRPVKIGRDAIEPHPVVHASEERPSIRGVFRQQNALTILLDLEKLLA